MPVFIRPGRVVVDDGGGNLLPVIAAIVALAAVVSSAAAIITDVLTAILMALGVLSVAGAVALVVVLRGSRLSAWRPPAPARAPVPGPAPVDPRVISAPRPLAIDPPTVHLTILSPEAPRRARED